MQRAGGEGAGDGTGIRTYDLSSQERIVRGRMPTLEIVNERFARNFRIGLFNFMRRNPDIAVEITIDYGLADVVADRFDAGVRLGGEMAKDMIAMRIGPDIPMAIVGTPDYFRAQSELNALQGQGNLWFAGSYMLDVDSHESGLRSAMAVV